MRKITKVLLITSLFTGLIGALMLLGACGSDPSYYGTYYANESDTSVTWTINGNGLYLGISANPYETKYDYTYENGNIFLLQDDVKIKFCLYENDQVFCLDMMKDIRMTGRFPVRDGHFNATIGILNGDYSLSCHYEFSVDGSYFYTSTDTYSHESGTYTLNNGVLIFNVHAETNSLGQFAPASGQHYAYIDSNHSFYMQAFVKNANHFAGNGTEGDNTNTPETPEPTPGTYTLSYVATEGGRIVGSTSQTVLEGENGTAVTAVANKGYEFAGWSDGVQSAERTDENVFADLTVTARFEKIPEYTLNYTAQTGGSIQGDASQTVLRGENGTAVTAVANKGYEFAGWSDGVQSAERTDENVFANLTVTARFEKIPEYTLNYTAQTGGSIQGDASQTVLRGENGTAVTAVANEGYVFAGWSDGVQSATRTEENVTENLTLTALFEINNTVQFAGGSGSALNPYRITTAQHLENMTLYPAAHYILMDNIVLTSVEQGQSNFTPLFDDEKMFTGVFDGNGHSISNLTIYNTSTFYTGLFACIGKDGKVFDLTLKSICLQGTNYIGGVAGYALGAVTNCAVTGEITHLAHNGYGVYLGGIAGRAENDLNGCAAEVTVTANKTGGTAYAGGLVGYGGDITLTNCYATGSVTGGDNANVGGLVGYGGDITLTNCYATGSVTGGYNADVGGLVGYGRDDITLTNCYATGSVTGGNYANVGGLVGYGSIITLTNCYATGSVSGDNYTGGLVGYGASITLNNCYATGSVTGSGNADVGGLVGYGHGGITLTNCYATGSVTGGNYTGGLVGYGNNSITLNNAHWLYFAESGVEYAVGYSSQLGIPTNIGGTKHTDISEFYNLADTLNNGQETPVWEHIGTNTLPTLVGKEN